MIILSTSFNITRTDVIFSRNSNWIMDQESFLLHCPETTSTGRRTQHDQRRLVAAPPETERSPKRRTSARWQSTRRLYRLSLDDPETFWAKQAERISWFHPWGAVYDHDYDNVDFGWFLGGRLNACYNCVDRHLKTRGDQDAIIWVKDEPGEYEHITYRQLKHEVSRVANVLRFHGVRRGDRVCIYMPMIPELAYTMLACARIGAVHSIVFGGFSSESIRDRILDAGARVVVTANEGLRGGRKLRLKETVDRAVDGLDLVETVLVARRTDTEVAMKPGRDHWLDEECRRQRSTCTYEWMGSEDPLFILYTSGSTGKPKGVLHTTGGYMVFAAMTHELVFDYHPGDVYFCAADIGWITGHSYIIYGPLANGATTVMFESVPTYPDPGRYWQVVDDLGVNIFYTAPTRPARHRLLRATTTSRSTRERAFGCWGPSANPSTPTPGTGTTTWSAMAAAQWSTPGGRPRPAAS